MSLPSEVYTRLRPLLLVVLSHFLFLVVILILLKGLIELSHALFPNPNPWVGTLELASAFSMVLLFVAWTAATLLQYGLSEVRRKK